MQVVKGKVTNNADGTSPIRPVLPQPPVYPTLIDELKKRIIVLDGLIASEQQNHSRLMASGDYTNANLVDIGIKNMASERNTKSIQVKALQAEYDAAYTLYESRIAQYNKDFAVWAEATAKLNNTEPEILKAQIAAETAKTDNALKIAAASSESSNKKWIIIAVIVVAIIAVAGFIWYKVKKG